MDLQWEEGQQKVLYFMPQQDGEEDMVMKMIEHNHIPGLLPMYRQYIDEQVCYTYEVQGYETLEKKLEQGEVSVKWVCQIVHQVLETILNGEEYFLCREAYCLSPSYMFLRHGGEDVRLCYLPGSSRDVYRDFRHLLESFMERLDHCNQKETTFFYSFYNMVSAQEVPFDDLLEHLCRYSREQHKQAEMADVPIQSGEMKQPQKETMQTATILEKTESCGLALLAEHGKIDWTERGRELLPSRVELKPGKYYVGRQQDRDIVLKPGQISRAHALLEVDEMCVYLTDQGSANGTFVNDRKISAHVRTRLAAGDVLTFADISYRLCSPQEAVNVSVGKPWNRRGNSLRVSNNGRLRLPFLPSKDP